ncbi:MAG TPA: lipid kinase YegS, partial [Pseudomonas sp.]|nr:lipid kinase YegS [Pseudomonas sp.]
LAQLPLGSANDFAQAAQIPLEPAAALDLLAIEATPIDLGLANERLFVNMATGGFGSLVTANTSEELKKVLGGGAYLLTGITRFAEVRSAFGRFQGPGFDWQGDFLALGIGNGRQAGGGHALCPNATIDDGLLDLFLIPAPQDAGETLRVLLGGGMLGLDTVAITARLPWLEVEAPEGLDLNLDGEPLHSARVRFDVRRRALRLHLPADSPLLTGAAAK